MIKYGLYLLPILILKSDREHIQITSISKHTGVIIIKYNYKNSSIRILFLLLILNIFHFPRIYESCSPQCNVNITLARKVIADILTQNISF